jgi:hypothetical protein
LVSIAEQEKCFLGHRSTPARVRLLSNPMRDNYGIHGQKQYHILVNATKTPFRVILASWSQIYASGQVCVYMCHQSRKPGFAMYPVNCSPFHSFRFDVSKHPWALRPGHELMMKI